MKRKTVSVKSLVDRANEYLASDTHYARRQTPMKPGTVVQFKEPLNEEERKERFLVLEDNGDRLLLGDLALSHWPIPPTICCRASYMEPTTDAMPNMWGKCSNGECGFVYYLGGFNTGKRCPKCGEVEVNE